ncbi:Two component sensor kinase [Sinorhizobium sojae CCBAU 05684]|uniref:Two component sensor kinase n=1 Tax=Sinorhizobium sojae CCBAU 05684 TaxID=716928 RepID=A0A249P7I6_9HYPH|nr:PAS domain-containing protein [Sinorhizobium sojae]ASY61881.1 Two component sensor kinase [Sinorhizobium sojae CCBAU 05684]
MDDVAPIGADIMRTVLESGCDALGFALLVCGRDDTILFASASIVQFFPVPARLLRPGTRLRDFLGAVYDTGVRPGTLPENSRRRANREDWIAEQMALHWRERYESVERAGRMRWLCLRKRRLPNGIGILSLTDITEQKKREEQLQTDMERIELTEEILDAQPNPICVKDRNLHYIAVNKAFCILHDLPAEAILGRSAWDLLDADIAERLEQSDRQVLATGRPHSDAEHMVRADGSDLWVVTRKYRVGMPGRQFVVTCMNDVTDIAAWYHGDGDGGSSSGLQIRDYSIFAPGQNFYDPFRALNVQQLVETGSMIETLPARGLRILLVTSDRDLEERVVARLRGSGLDACAVRDLEELDAFASAAESRGVKLDVLLLDRALAGRDAILASWRDCPLVEVSGGTDVATLLTEIFRACAERRPARSLFPQGDFEISFEDDAGPGAVASKLDVLVAEDNQINQFVFAQILDGLGLSYRIAADGREALELWQELRPAIVLMDVTLPILNGFEAAAAIRETEKRTGGRTPIVAVIVQAFDVDLDQCRVSGMDDHIMKPISPDMIEAVLRKYVPAGTLSAAG